MAMDATAKQDEFKPFEVIQGGLNTPSPMGKGPPPTKDWLSPIAKGSVFVCRFKNPREIAQRFVLMPYHVVYCFPKTRLLLDNHNPMGEGLLLYVDPEDFCKFFDLVEVLIDGSERNRPD